MGSLVKKSEIIVGDSSLQQDFHFSRDEYYSLLQKSEEAVDMMMDFAKESDSPRSWEVLGNMLRQRADIIDRLMDLQKKKVQIEGASESGGSSSGSSSITQNNVYIGTVADLQKVIHNKLMEKV
jgi:hypothetical protein